MRPTVTGFRTIFRASARRQRMSYFLQSLLVWFALTTSFAAFFAVNSLVRSRSWNVLVLDTVSILVLLTLLVKFTADCFLVAQRARDISWHPAGTTIFVQGSLVAFALIGNDSTMTHSGAVSVLVFLAIWSIVNLILLFGPSKNRELATRHVSAPE